MDYTFMVLGLQGRRIRHEDLMFGVGVEGRVWQGRVEGWLGWVCHVRLRLPGVYVLYEVCVLGSYESVRLPVLASTVQQLVTMWYTADQCKNVCKGRRIRCSVETRSEGRHEKSTTALRDLEQTATAECRLSPAQSLRSG